MKKLLFALLALISLSIISVYIFIPDQITISTVEEVESSDRIIANFINESRNRNQWWPKDSSANLSTPDTITQDNGYHYQFNPGTLSSVNVLITKDDLKTNSVITWLPESKSTYKISWRTAFEASKNPVERFLQYQKARKLKDNMNLVFEKFLSYIVNTKNIYGINIERKLVRDTIVATSTMSSSSYPETGKVYSLIDEVKSYAGNKGSKPVNVPMLNISRDPRGGYLTMVAIPINKNIQTDNRVKINHLVPGNILVTEIKGGRGKIEEGFNQLKFYINDFKLTSPAMPFESLVTDRTKEPDTSRWITRIYYPIY
jgi:effector-binding domain-containing protein